MLNSTPLLLACDKEIAARSQAKRDNRTALELEFLAERGRRRLSDFVRAAWDTVEPGRRLLWNWHLDAVCDHLEAVTAGQIFNLLITIPPGSSKSRIVGVYWPVWTWLRAPETRWLFLANDPSLATRESLACRHLMQSEWFTTHYPDCVKLTGDQNAKEWYENEKRGHRQSLSIGANITGKKADIIAVDDANDSQKVHQSAYRDGINATWNNAIYNRVIDFRTGKRVVIGQRTHKNDLIGHIKETSNNFQELCIPEEFDSARRFTTSIGWTDPRVTDGEWLRPLQFTAAEKADALLRLGTAGYGRQHLQLATTVEGNQFKAAWLRHWTRDENSPDVIVLDDARGEYRLNLLTCERFATCDPASSAKQTADYSVFCLWVVSPRGDLVMMDCVRRQIGIPQQPQLLAEVYDRWKFKLIGIEAVASNSAMLQFAVAMHLPAISLNPKGRDKLAHAQGAIITAEGGQLWLPGPRAVPGFPLEAVRGELLAFTGIESADEHDDIVDNCSYACELKPRFYRPQSTIVDPARYIVINPTAPPLQRPRGPGR